MECSICGVSDRRRRVFEAISPTGIAIVCEKCAFDQGFPEVKRPGPEPETKRRDTVYETMVRLSGVRPKEEKKRELQSQEGQIREIANKNYESSVRKEQPKLGPREDLVENFHWVIMRVRRVKGLTQSQLAERIGESEAAVKMAEQGVVPQGYELLEKLERFLGVRLIREKRLEPGIQGQPKKAINFGNKVLSSLTIADLKRMKEEREEEEKERNREMIR